MNIIARKIGRTVAGLAAVLVVSGGAANAATVSNWANLDDLVGGDSGGLTIYSPVNLQGSVLSAEGSLNLIDNAVGSNLSSGTGSNFKFNYTFTSGGATSVSGYIADITGGASSYAIKLVDLTTHTVLVSSGTAGSYGGIGAGLGLTYSGSGLNSTDKYDFIVSGKLNGAGTAGFQGGISAVPVPGALVLFGSGLLGLAGASRRRRAKKLLGGVAVAALAVPLALLGLSGKAEAATESVTLATAPTTFTGTLDFSGKINAAGTTLSSKGYYIPTGTIAAIDSKTGTSVTASGPTDTFDFSFSVGSASKLSSVYLTGSGTGSPTLKLYQGSNLQTAVGGIYSLAANTTYEFVVSNVANAKNATLGLSGTVSAVPIPGALVLFGSGLVGLAGYARRSRKSVTA
jgi:hypothetical protein